MNVYTSRSDGTPRVIVPHDAQCKAGWQGNAEQGSRCGCMARHRAAKLRQHGIEHMRRVAESAVQHANRVAYVAPVEKRRAWWAFWR